MNEWMNEWISDNLTNIRNDNVNYESMLMNYWIQEMENIRNEKMKC